MNKFARYKEFDKVKLKQDRPKVQEPAFTQLKEPRAVRVTDPGVVMLVYDVPDPGYEVEFFNEEGETLDVITLQEDEIELRE